MIGRQVYEPDPEEEAFYASRPRIAVAFDAAVGHLADDGDRRALVLALVEHMPPEWVAELLARLIECHPEGAKLVRVLTTAGNRGELRGIVDSRRRAVVVGSGGRWLGGKMRWDWRATGGRDVHDTREAAEAALIAAQPVPAAVVRVRE